MVYGGWFRRLIGRLIGDYCVILGAAGGGGGGWKDDLLGPY